MKLDKKKKEHSAIASTSYDQKPNLFQFHTRTYIIAFAAKAGLK